MLGEGSAQDEARATNASLHDERVALAEIRAETQRLRTRLEGADPIAGGDFEVRQNGVEFSVAASDLPSLARLESILDESGIAGRVSPGSPWVERAATATRSINECFYGPLWTHDERVKVLDATWRRGANAYVYGPSADTLNGGDWRTLYAGVQKEQLAAFTSEAATRGVNAIWRVSPSAPLEPSRSIDLTSAADLRDFLAKCEQVIDMGFGGILIAFDDVTEEGGFGASAMTGIQIAEAQAAFVNSVMAALSPITVVTCPTQYWGVEPSPLRRRFSEHLSDGVQVIWTGPDVISRTITRDQVVAVGAEMGKPVWIWDNYPVNDWDAPAIGDLHSLPVRGLDNFVMPRHLPLAPVRGRGDSVHASAGYGANAAMGAVYSIPALETALDYAWEGATYDADVAWNRAMARTRGDAEALRYLADAVAPQPGAADDRVPALALACIETLAAFAGESQHERGLALKELERTTAANLEAIRSLRSAPSSLIRDAWPWVEEWARQCALASYSLAVLKGEAKADRGLSEISRLLAMHPRVSVALDAATPLAHYCRARIFGRAPDVPRP